MIGFADIHIQKPFLCIASLVLIGAVLAAQVDTARKEPIAYIGHGAMFDQNGREVVPTTEFIREAQDWYRNDLLEKLTQDERAQFDKLESRLAEGLALDEQSRLVLNAHLLEWLIKRAKIGDRDRLLGKNNLMKLDLNRRLPTKPKAGLIQDFEPFKLPQELLERLKTEGLIRTDRPVAFSVTTAAGNAYITECSQNGVPIPPGWNTDGSTGWVNRGLIPSTDLFISKTRQAEVFTYQSASPEGMCIALPRYFTNGPIDLLGVICLGKVSKKVCFWDNLNFTPAYNAATIPFNQFSGGTDLGSTGICSDCHAGENPYIIHPQTTALGGLKGLGLPTSADDWYEPHVKSGWPQNPGPVNAPEACVGCHKAGGEGGRFPHLSTDLTEYCLTILDQAIAKTMPPGAPGTLAGDPQVTAFRNWCLAAPGGDPADRGDPHLTTVDGVNYDFQSAGEFVALRSTDGLQIQTRQTPVATTSTVGPNPHTGLTTCVSLNTAVAAQVGKHRVTFQPNLSGAPDPSGLQLRVDGVLTTLGAQGLNLGSGGRVMKSTVGDGIEIHFPAGVHLIVTPGWWGAPQNMWYLNLDIINFSARQGIMGNIAPGSWLPALPNGTSLGPMPATLRQRYLDLHQKFADAWRVNARTSLFDYAPRTSTASFTLRNWPPENPPCVIRGTPAAKPLDRRRAQQLCRPILDKNMNADCVFDVRVTGEAGFAKTYLLTQQLRAGSTTIFVNDDQDPTQVEAPVTFTATVVQTAAGGKGYPAGTVQFTLDGSKVGAPVKLDSKGGATWRTSSLQAGTHQVAASYIPGRNSVFLASSSLDEPHTVRREATPPVRISNLPMQGGDEKTPCPALGVIYKRSDAASVPYLGIMLPNLDQQCGSKGPGLLVATVKFLKCAPDPRGKGFGPNATADLTCVIKR